MLNMAYQQGTGVPARGVLLEGCSGGALLGLPPGHLFCQGLLILQTPEYEACQTTASSHSAGTNVGCKCKVIVQQVPLKLNVLAY